MRSVCPRDQPRSLGLKGPPTLLLFGSTSAFLPLVGAFPVSFPPPPFFSGAAHCSLERGEQKGGEMYSRLVWLLEENCYPRSSRFPGLLACFCKGGGVYLKECEDRSFFGAGKTNYRVSGFGVSHSLAERIPHVLKAEGACLGHGRPEIPSAVDLCRTLPG